MSGLLPDPIGRTAPRVLATDPRYAQALAESEKAWGFRVERVLLPSQWAVFEVDGHAEVCMNGDGVRALALLSPRPDAAQVAERLIDHAKRGGSR